MCVHGVWCEGEALHISASTLQATEMCVLASSLNHLEKRTVQYRPQDAPSSASSVPEEHVSHSLSSSSAASPPRSDGAIAPPLIHGDFLVPFRERERAQEGSDWYAPVQRDAKGSTSNSAQLPSRDPS